jgi:ABC-type amino acid transport substrate-binding protein
MGRPESKDFEVIGELRIGEGVGIAVKSDDKELGGKLNEGIKAVYADGTFQKLNEKYFPFSLSRDK